MEFVILPPQSSPGVNLSELWKYRELFASFALRDFSVRYKQTVLGIAWAVFQPLLTMIIFSIFFGQLAKIQSDNIPYPIFVYSGLIFWNFFSSSLSGASNSLIENENILKKVYFPRVILPLSVSLTSIIDFFFTFVIFIFLSLYFGIIFNILYLPLILFLLFISFITSTGLGMFLAAINTKYRDVRYILPFFIQLLMFITPVIYSISIVPPEYRLLAFINPMCGVITVFRDVFLSAGEINWIGIVISFLSSVTLFSFGLTYFKKVESFFADIL